MRPTGISREAHEIYLSHQSLRSLAGRAHPEPDHRRPARILVADPSGPARAWLCSALSRMPNHMHQAASGSDVLDVLSDTPVDLLIVSARLPQIPGAQLLAMLRAAGSRVPVILMQPFPSDSIRALVHRVRPAQLIEDWTDTTALRHAASRLLVGNDASPSVP